MAISVADVNRRKQTKEDNGYIVQWLIDGRLPEVTLINMADVFLKEDFQEGGFVFDPRKPPPSIDPTSIILNTPYK